MRVTIQYNAQCYSEINCCELFTEFPKKTLKQIIRRLAIEEALERIKFHEGLENLNTFNAPFGFPAWVNMRGLARAIESNEISTN